MSTSTTERDTTTAKRRSLNYPTFAEMIQDLETLREVGYERTGNWTLSDACNHLALVVEQCMDGFPKNYPWIMRKMARWLFLKKMLRRQKSTRRFEAPAFLQPPSEQDDAVAVERLTKAIERFQAHSEDLQPSPIFGKLTKEQWQEIHLWHAEHHLSFLHPGRRDED